MPKLDKTNKGSSAKVPPYFKDTVVERIIEVEFGESKSNGRPQIMMKTEIVQPDKVKVGEEEFIIGGQTITRYLGLSTEPNAKSDVSPWNHTCSFFEKVGLPTEIDTDDPELNKKLNESMIGYQFENVLASQEKVVTRRNEKGVYVPVLDGRGNKIKNGFEWNTFLTDVLGKASVETNRPY